jgi:hypothetical protein
MPETPVLTSWKEIAAYLGKGVRTVQRWEGELKLPVRRPYGLDKHVVIALPDELDNWVHQRLRPRSNRPAGSQVDHSEQLERMRRLLQCMVERTQLLHDNVEVLRNNAQQMVRRRQPSRGNGEPAHTDGAPNRSIPNQVSDAPRSFGKAQ